METNIAHIQTLKESITQEIDKRNRQAKNLLNHITIKALESASNRLNRIDDIIFIDAYDLIFIGEVGAGKTTAICHLFNLVYEEDVKTTKGKKTRIVRVIKDVFPTGSGATTLCEFIIHPDESTFLAVETYDDKNLEQIFDNFCEYIWYRAYKESDSTTVESLSPELERAIRNMVDLREVTRRVQTTAPESANETDTIEMLSETEEETEPVPSDGGKKKSATQREDRAIQFAQTFEESQKQEFKDAVRERARLHERTQMCIEPPESFSNVNAEKVWLAKTCSQLNIAALPNVPLPKRVRVHISPDILSLRDYPYVQSVIDTKGLQTGQSRKDLESYICNQDNALCIFTDRFPHAPDGMLTIMQTYLTRESQDIDSRSLMIILPQGEEPEKIVTPDGTPAGDWDEGCELRKASIDANLTSKVKFLPNNIVFYDAKRYYRDGQPDMTRYIDLGSMLDPSELEEAKQQAQQDIEKERQRVFVEIEQVIEGRKQLLWNEVERLRSDFDRIKTGGGLSEDDKSRIRTARRKVTELKTCDFSAAADFTEKHFLAWLEELHAMTLRATNNRFGEYEIGYIDIYFTAGQLATTLTADTFRPYQARIIERFEDIAIDSTVLADIEPVINQFKRDINSSFDQFTNDVGKKVENRLKHILAPHTLDNPFWCDVQDRFGQGPGYKQDIIGMYADKLENKVNSFLKRTAEELWRDKFIQNILDFFGDKEN
jgi:hypothetical protein